jgi:hypothetical protein
MYLIVLKETNGVGWSCVDLMAGKQPSSRAFDSEPLGRDDLIHLHGLAVGKKREKVGEKDVEHFQRLCLLAEWEVDAERKKQISMYKNTSSLTAI